MIFYIDADSVPAKIRTYLINICNSNKINLEFISNSTLDIKENDNIKLIITDRKDQAVDNYILSKITANDFLLTRDYLFASLALSKCKVVINDRGIIFTKEYLEKKIQDKQMMDALFAGGFVQHGKKKKIDYSDFQNFKSTIEKLLLKSN